MHIRVLGSAAGGGFPQWNCDSPRCRAARRGRLVSERRSQSSIAVSQDGHHWLLVNVSPDIRQQILDNTMLHPSGAVRSSGIAAIALMDSQIDHVTGLLMMRESDEPLSIYCTKRTEEDLRTGFPIFEMLSHYCRASVTHLPLDGHSIEPDETPGVRILPIPLTSKAPPYSRHRQDPRPGDNVGFVIDSPDTGKRAFYAPGLGEIDDRLSAWMASADIIMVDGTTWTDDEMSKVVGGKKTSRQMGHLPLTGEGGMLDVLADYPLARRILVHINNTNPVLDPESAERARLEAMGIEVSYDGMDIRF
ncbi:pyrroloquinoline quinone biosynthesis protein PqqB [Spiribacter roseus]|jgi:pyrroloquinoline quinone biosynthesis protein B|uniref:pyrroloquinoline quinone biosynthesis protein PqqB n=1 Tax=Spiribacter roseus TaxID=1855875 RepID=UPI00132FAC82|nr:pyrroloquinoline quinone biosynthesis protein PqqB [Spiribacter roseus]KAF0281064.1 pyrroloquinoline quinone biosynthesis protein PqqB [Spiribacter roseus]